MAISFASGLYQVNCGNGHIPTGLNSGVAAFFLSTAINSMAAASPVNTGNGSIMLGATDGRSSWCFSAGHNDNLNDAVFGGRLDGTFAMLLDGAETTMFGWSGATFNGSGIAYTEDKGNTLSRQLGWWQIAGDAVARCGTAILDPGIAVTGVQTIDVGVDPKMILWASSFLGVTTNTSGTDGEGRIFLGITTIQSDGSIYNRCLSTGMTDTDNPATGWRQQATSLCIHFGTAARVTQYAHAVTAVASGYVQLQVQDTTFTQSTLVGFLAIGGANLAAASGVASHPATDGTFTSSMDLGTAPGLVIALSAGNTLINSLTATGNTIRFLGGFATSPQSQSGHGIMWRNNIDYTTINSAMSAVYLDQVVMWNSLGFGGLTGRAAIRVESLQAGMITWTCSDADGNSRPFLFFALSDATPSGGTVYTITHTDGIFLDDGTRRAEEHTQLEGMLLADSSLKDLRKVVADYLLLSEDTVRQIALTAIDSVLLDEIRTSELRRILYDGLLLGEEQTITTIAGTVQYIIATDSLLLGEDVVKLRTLVADDPFFLGSDRSIHTAHTFLDSLLIYDESVALRILSVAAIDYLFLSEERLSALHVLTRDGILLDDFARRLLVMLAIEGLLLGSSGTGTRIPASTATAFFFAVLRAYNPLGLSPSHVDYLGRVLGHNEPRRLQ